MYAERVEKDRLLIDQALKKLVDFNPLPFQMNVIWQAKFISELLNDILGFVVTTPAYIKEKESKPAYDRQQELLKMELHERQERLAAELREQQARLAQEKRNTERALIEEKNKTQQLANHQAQIERDRNRLEIKEQEIMLNLMRIQEGEAIKQALKKNDSEWQYKINELKCEYNVLRAQESEQQKKVIALESERGYLQKYNASIQNRLVLALDALKYLEEAIPNLPCNPDFVDGLRDYVDKLKSHTFATYAALEG